MARQSRTKRQPGVRVELSARDEALLRAIARFRLVRTADLAALFFPGRHADVCAERLRRLFDAGYLEVHVTERAAPNLYSLGPAGRKWLVDQGGAWLPAPRGGWDHHLGVVQVWAMLAAVLHGRSGLGLTRFVPEWEIRSKSPYQATVVPDALVEVGRIGGECRGPVRIALEVDLGTESLPVLRKKLRAYRELKATRDGVLGWESFGLVLAVLGRGVARVGTLRQLVAEEWGADWATWITKDEVAAWTKTILGSPQVPVTDSRFGNGREGDASRGKSRDQDVTGGTLSENESRA
jgi:hypothetical protein